MSWYGMQLETKTLLQYKYDLACNAGRRNNASIQITIGDAVKEIQAVRYNNYA
jgi:hypothetical protein